jgi:outer membrane protein TolC
MSLWRTSRLHALLLGGQVLCAIAAFAQAAEAPPGSALPDDATVREVLQKAPAILAAREQIAQGLATQRKLSAGEHEWEVSATDRRRTEATGRSFREQEYELARSVRLPGKRSLDLQIGQQTANNGEFAFEDAWHEAGRLLLAGWFNWLRAERSSVIRAQLRDVQKNLLETAARRVSAGDAPQLEERVAATELQRAEYELIQSRQAALVARSTLLQEYPALDPVLPAALPRPLPLQDSDAIWLERIVQSNHEIKLADGRAAAAGLEARRARLERLADPRLALIYSSNFDQNRETIGLKVTVPLGGRARGAEAAMAASRARATSAEAQLANLRVNGDARTDLANCRAYYDQWQSLAEAAGQAQQNAAAYARGYGSGEFDLIAMLNAQQLAAQAALSAEAAQLSALEANARLRLDAHQLWAPDED